MTTCTPTLTGTPMSGSPTATFGGPTPQFVTYPTPTVGRTSDYWPRFSPDGATILFTRTSNGGTSFLATVPSAGGEVVEFPPPGPTRTPIPVSASRSSWSWNTTLTEHQIAFTGESAAGAFLYLISVDGSGLEEVSPPGTGNEVFYPSWYPDGVNVGVVAAPAGASAGQLLRIDTAAQTSEQLTYLVQIYAGESAVSRDGTGIAFAGQLNCGAPYDQSNNQIWLLDLASGGLAQLDPQEGRTPDWSPDDRYLSFESTRFCADGNYTIVISPAAGGPVLQLTDCVYDGNHSVWSPDGSRIAFSAVIPGTSNRGIAIVPVPPIRE